MSKTTQSPAMLITGATGNVGSALAAQLSSLNIPFRAMVRSRKRAQHVAALKTAQLVEGDFTDKASLKQALQGIEKAFLLTASSAQAESQQSTFVRVADELNTPHIIKLSQWAADIHSPVRFLRYHGAIEQKIKASGMAYTFLRPNLFMQGLLGFKESIVRDDTFFATIDDSPISIVDVRDIAAVAAAVLTQSHHEGKTYSITGPEALTHQQMAAKLSSALRRPIRFESVPEDVMRNTLMKVGFPAWQAYGLIEDYAHYARGEAAEVTTDTKNLIGRLPFTFDEFAKDYAAAFTLHGHE